MSKQPYKIPKIDSFKALLPELVQKSSRFCIHCRWVIEEQRDIKHEKCGRCQEKLPLVKDLDYPAEAWWLRCKKCFVPVRSDFKYCELCGLDLANSVKEAKIKQAAHLKEEEAKKQERKIIREEQEKLSKRIREFEEEKARWEAERLKEFDLEDDDSIEEEMDAEAVDAEKKM